MKIAIIINSITQPQKRRVIVAALRDALKSHDLDIRLTEYAGHATILAREAVNGGVVRIVVVGGDGTVGEVANGVIGSNVSLAVIPTGTANDLANHLGIPRSVADACSLIGSGHIRQIDLIRINGRYVLTTAGFGIGCETIAQARRLRRARFWKIRPVQMIGHRLYAFCYALAIARKQDWPRQLSLLQNGLELSCNVLSLTISNIPRLGHRFLMAPEARLDDGLFDICVIDDHGRLGALQAVVRACRGLGTDTPRVRQWRAASVTVESSCPIPYFSDGDLLSATTRFEVRIVPGAVTFIVPGEKEGG
jgi:diacylglycerol kinase (ATP)